MSGNFFFLVYCSVCHDIVMLVVAADAISDYPICMSNMGFMSRMRPEADGDVSTVTT